MKTAIYIPCFWVVASTISTLSIPQTTGTSTNSGSDIQIPFDPSVDIFVHDDNEKKVSRKPRRVKSGHDASEEEDYDEMKLINENKSKKSNPPVSASPRITQNQDYLNLPDGYSIYEIPKEPSGAAMPLFVHIHIKKILEFDELDSMIKLDLEFVVMWTDFRIMNNNKNINFTRRNHSRFVVDDMTLEEVRANRITLNNPYVLEKVWKPNLFISSLLAVRQPNIMSKPLTVKFIPEAGAFQYITRISVTIECEMDFHYYPADTQMCGFSMRGFSYIKPDLNLNWYKRGVYLDGLDLPSWDVKLEDTTKFDWQKGKDPHEVFEVLAFKIYARRRLSYHLVQTYLASMFYIIITCLCFLLPARLTEARIGIAMTALLTLTAMFGSIRESTPIVSYVKAIDIWMVCCIFFVFLALAQITFHTWFRTVKQDFDDSMQKIRDAHEKRKRSRQYSIAMSLDETSPRNSLSPEDEIEHHHVDPHYLRKRRQSVVSAIFSDNVLQKYEQYDVWIDRYSFGLFISVFLMFCIIYWIVLLIQADYLDWKVDEKLNNIEGSKRR